jgi:hypothetical protein
MKPLIDVRIADEELEGLAQGGQSFGPQLSRLLDDEMARFEAWMNRSLGGGLTRVERAAVKRTCTRRSSDGWTTSSRSRSMCSTLQPPRPADHIAAENYATSATEPARPGIRAARM